jgi:hypothetical protein
MLDSTADRVAKTWGNPKALRDAIYVYEDGAARDFVTMCNLPRGGRVALPQSRWDAPIELGVYPITVVF